MKPYILILPLLALSPLRASAQTPAAKNRAPKARAAKAPAPVPPEVTALLAAAMKTYGATRSISFGFAYSSDFPFDTGIGNNYEIRVWYSSPALMRVERRESERDLTMICDGQRFYSLMNGKSSRWRLPAGKRPLVAGYGGRVGRMIDAMMAGQNPILAIREPYASEPSRSFTTNTVYLPPRLVEGQILRGVQDTFSMRSLSNKVTREETTAWFGGSPLALRRVQIRSTWGDESMTATEKIIDQQFSPEFPEDTFTLNLTALKRDEPGLDAARLRASLWPLPEIRDTL